MAGLFGLGGIGGIGGAQPPAGLLGPYFNPADMRKQQLKQGLLAAGIGLLTGGKGSTGEVLGQGLAAGLQGANNAGINYKQDAMGYNKMAQDMEEQAAKRRQKEAIMKAVSEAPTHLQQMFAEYPELGAKWIMDREAGSDTTYETITTNEGIFRVPNNNPDPSKMVRVGDRPDRNEGEGREFTQEAKLRDSYIKQSKPYEDLRVNYQRIQAANQDNTGASDIAMVYSFMKMLDPTSVVREGEFATAQNAGGVSDQVRSMYNRAINGERLTPEIRASFVQQSEAQYQQQLQSYEQTVQTYRKLAEEYGISPDRVTPDLTYGVTIPPKQPPVNQVPKLGGKTSTGVPWSISP